MNSRRSPLQGRRAAGLVFGLFVAAGLVIVFGGTLARSTDLESRAAKASAEVALLQQRVEAGEAEIAFMTSEAFLLQQSRAEGFGEAGEKRFALPDGAPSPPPIEPIGSEREQAEGRAPFDAWMDLLFGE